MNGPTIWEAWLFLHFSSLSILLFHPTNWLWSCESNFVLSLSVRSDTFLSIVFEGAFAFIDHLSFTLSTGRLTFRLCFIYTIVTTYSLIVAWGEEKIDANRWTNDSLAPPGDTIDTETRVARGHEKQRASRRKCLTSDKKGPILTSFFVLIKTNLSKKRGREIERENIYRSQPNNVFSCEQCWRSLKFKWLALEASSHSTCHLSTWLRGFSAGQAMCLSRCLSIWGIERSERRKRPFNNSERKNMPRYNL